MRDHPSAARWCGARIVMTRAFLAPRGRDCDLAGRAAAARQVAAVEALPQRVQRQAGYQILLRASGTSGGPVCRVRAA